MKAEQCLVCDWEIKDEGIDVQAGGHDVAVCCDDCAEKVEQQPTKYAGPAK